MKIRAKLKTNGEVVYIIQILFDELRCCPVCVYIKCNGKELLFGAPNEFDIDDGRFKV